ncbi:hypothetical protein MY11210_008184 [Beauveria gryllotalpidicola]
MFMASPKLSFVMDADDNIVQMIIPAFHGQFAFNNSGVRVSAQWDLIYNAGCELANISVVELEHFTLMSKRDRSKSALEDYDNPWQSQRVNKIMALDFESGKITPALMIIKAFAHILKCHPELEKEMLACEEHGHAPIAVLSDDFAERREPSEAGRRPYKKRQFADRTATPNNRQLMAKYDTIMDNPRGKDSSGAAT